MIHIPIENATEDIDDEGTVIPPVTADASKQLASCSTSGVSLTYSKSSCRVSMPKTYLAKT